MAGFAETMITPSLGNGPPPVLWPPGPTRTERHPRAPAPVSRGARPMERIPYHRVERDRLVPPAPDPCDLPDHDGDRPDHPALERVLTCSAWSPIRVPLSATSARCCCADAPLPGIALPAAFFGVLLTFGRLKQDGSWWCSWRRLWSRAAARSGGRAGVAHDPARRPDPRLHQPARALCLPRAQAQWLKHR